MSYFQLLSRILSLELTTIISKCLWFYYTFGYRPSSRGSICGSCSVSSNTGGCFIDSFDPKTEKHKRGVVKNQTSILNNFRTQITNMSYLLERHMKQMMRKRIGYTSRWTRRWTLDEEHAGLSWSVLLLHSLLINYHIDSQRST